MEHNKYELYLSKEEYEILQEQVEIGLARTLEDEKYHEIGLLYSIKIELGCRAK